MNTPTLPHVPRPQLDVHDVADRVADRASDLGELVSDAFSTGYEKVHDLAVVAVDVIEDLPDKAVALAGTVIPALRPTRRRRNPWLILVAVVVSVAVVAWVLKRRRASSEPVALPPASTSTPKPASAAS